MKHARLVFQSGQNRCCQHQDSWKRGLGGSNTASHSGLQPWKVVLGGHMVTAEHEADPEWVTIKNYRSLQTGTSRELISTRSNIMEIRNGK